MNHDDRKELDSTPIRVGIIGAGDVARGLHLPELTPVPGVDVVACADVDEATARATAAQFGIPQVYSAYQDLLAREEIDAVVVATPHTLHAPIAAEAFAARKHVLVQKPMATRREDADRLVEAYHKSGRVGMALPYLFSPAFVAGRDLIRQGAIGQPVMAHARVAHSGPGRERWFYQKAIAQGGALFDMGVYAVTALTTLLGPASHVSAMTTTTDLAVNVDENAALLVRFAHGALGTAETSWRQQAGREVVIVYGTEGTVQIALNHWRQGVELFSTDAAASDRRGWLRMELPHLPRGLPTAHGHFIDSIRAGTAPWATIEQGRHVSEILIAGYEAADSGQTLALATAF
jgi:predicted dehydrogenase